MLSELGAGIFGLRRHPRRIGNPLQGQEAVSSFVWKRDTERGEDSHSGDTLMIKSQLTLFLENKPGELARATSILAAARVNIEGISVAETTDIGLVQIVVSDLAAARPALMNAGIATTEQKVVILNVANEPGEIAKLASKLAENDININYLYATSAPAKGNAECSVILSADDLEKVNSLLSQKV